MFSDASDEERKALKREIRKMSSKLRKELDEGKRSMKEILDIIINCFLLHSVKDIHKYLCVTVEGKNES